jgi:hypothetical protein
MAINLGSTAISNIKLGSTQINKVYLGSTEVWSHQQPLPIPDYGYLYLYGYTVTQNSITNVTGGTVTINDEFMYEDVFKNSGGVSPIQVSVTGTDAGDPGDWEVTAVDASSQTLWIDQFMLSMAVSISALSSPFNVSFTANVGSVIIDKTTVNLRTIQSAYEFEQLADDGMGTLALDNIPAVAVKSVVVGQLITETPSSFLKDCTNLESVDMTNATSLTTIGHYFLYSDAYDAVPLSAITFPEGVTAIGDYCLAGAGVNLNEQITFPSTLKTIGTGLLMSNRVYTKPIILPSGLTKISNIFLGWLQQANIEYVDVGNLSPSVNSEGYSSSLSYVNTSMPGYVSGMKIKGANRAAWLSAFPNTTSGNINRKLIDYGS